MRLACAGRRESVSVYSSSPALWLRPRIRSDGSVLVRIRPVSDPARRCANPDLVRVGLAFLIVLACVLLAVLVRCLV